ncbi:type II toxin-antitoxin system antitoxin SocA domain-containing protein [uncultured Clostridium sp.]|jgi:uncharacterized phage-associated protein|uniref:Panacea domain-containing protein n=1 Tax=uncultured Clostridium sp. TaxID=59620 RepID=UPI002620DB2C|nr:type II toxin-antitoxin system antitoxin SocA domain-containing protein [uncultured Clostridium sp.]
MGYKALDVARYIINYSDEKSITITNLKLQKLLYYIQAAFLVDKKESTCFDEDIINWEYGPVVAEVYNEFRAYGRDILPKQETYTTIYFDEISHNIKMDEKVFDNSIIVAYDKDIIERIIHKYASLSAFELVQKTHKELPWKESIRNSIIQNKKIKEYFIENKENIS